MNKTQITVGGIIGTLIVSGLVALTGGQVDIPIRVSGDWDAIVYESAEDCEASRNQMLLNLEAKTLTGIEAATLIGMRKKKCSTFTEDFDTIEIEKIQNIITDGIDRVYYSYTDYLNNR